MMSTSATWLAIFIMAAVTYFTRAIGAWFAARIKNPKRLERLLKHLSSSMLAALVAPALASGDITRLVGVATACLVMIISKRALLSLCTGVLITTTLRTF
ncbi:AzlD family protein [Kordiimonas sp.]|uniref:AzlD family protein n=1 Tax=Kordiimonas sp. TaxID=1970157 RepID=UPI003A949230